MADKTKMIDRDQLGEKLHEAINIALIGLGINFNPRANDLGEEIDTFVELVLDFSEWGNEGLCNDQMMPDNILGQ